MNNHRPYPQQKLQNNTNKINFNPHSNPHNYRNHTLKSVGEPIKREIQQMKQMNGNLVYFINNLIDIQRNKPIKNVNVEIGAKFNNLQQKLGVLIENIKTYFIDMDTKVKGLASIILQYENQKTNNYRTHNFVQNRNSKPFDGAIDTDKKYNELANKINILEKSLNQTKNNENKLIGVIQQMMRRYGINEEPTIIKNDPQIHHNFVTKKNFSHQNQHILEFQGSLDQSLVTSNLNQLKQKQEQINRYHMTNFHSKNQNIGQSNGEIHNYLNNHNKGLNVKAVKSAHGLNMRSHGNSFFPNHNQQNINKLNQNLSSQKSDRNRRMQYMMSKLVI